MVIDPHAAAHFIDGYKKLLTDVYRQSGGAPKDTVIEVLSEGRRMLLENPVVFEKAMIYLKKSNKISSDVLQAIKTLRFGQWVFLKDTRAYSVFINSDRREAFAVLGLTERIRNIFGGSAVTCKTGVVEYCGRYVCDGIVESPIWLGPNMKREFNATLSCLKESGQFHVQAEGIPGRL